MKISNSSCPIRVFNLTRPPFQKSNYYHYTQSGEPWVEYTPTSSHANVPTLPPNQPPVAENILATTLTLLSKTLGGGLALGPPQILTQSATLFNVNAV